MAAATTGTAEKEREAKGSLMENTFILALEATVLQILEVWDTLCIAESENEEESNYDGSKRRYQSDRYVEMKDSLTCSFMQFFLNV